MPAQTLGPTIAAHGAGMNGTILLAPLGGVLEGAALTAVLALTGRSIGVSAMAGALLHGEPRDRAFAAAFLTGLVAAGAIAAALAPGAFANETGRSGLAFVAGGFLVGWGARRANGCTSGHGMIGVARGSARSIVAVVLFATVAAIVVALHPAGGAP